MGTHRTRKTAPARLTSPAMPSLRHQFRNWLGNNTIGYILQHLPYSCRFNTTRGTSFQQGNTIVHSFCKKLYCRDCATRLYHAMQPQLRDAIVKHAPMFHVTLSIPPQYDQDSTARDLVSGIGRLLDQVRRSFPQPLHYVWVLGRGRHLHLHMLVNHDLSTTMRSGRRTRWLKDVWHRLTCGLYVCVRKVKSGTENHMAQYMLQNLLQTATCRLGRIHRYGSSRSIVLSPHPGRGSTGGGKWKRLNLPSAAIARLHGVDSNPLTNGTYHLPDAAASVEPGRASTPLSPDAAGGGAPAGGRGGSGASLRGLAVPPAQSVPVNTVSRLQAAVSGRRS